MSNSLKVVTGNHYLAFVLDEECRERVLKQYVSKHPIEKCHHVTIAYNFGEEDIPRLQRFVDSNPEFSLHFMFITDVVDCFHVLVNGKLEATDRSFTHLTFKLAENAESSDSNRVLKNEIPYTGSVASEGLLTGHFELIEKKVK